MSVADISAEDGRAVARGAGTAVEQGKATARRSLLFDTVKGLAIALVALGHTNQGEINRGWWGRSAFGVHLDAFIYSFHMPAFFFVAGVFLRSSLAKRGPWGFAEQKLKTIFYPSVLWSLLLPFEPVVFRRYMREPAPTLRPYLLNLITGNTSWFLITLFVTVMVAMLLAATPLGPCFLATAVLAFFWHPVGIASIDASVVHLPFVIAGMWLGTRPSLVESLSRPASLLLAVVIGCGMTVFTSWAAYPTWRHDAFLPMGLLGTGMLLLLGRATGKSIWAKGTAWVGVGSFGVFLLSPFPQGGVRELLRAVHMTQPVVQLVVPTLFAIALPAWIYQRRELLHVAWMFAWPERRGGSERP